MKFLNKNPRKLIYIPVIFICVIGISLLFINCSSCIKIERESIDKLSPSFSGSGMEIVDLNGGDAYPGESVGVNISVVNNGDIEARNVKVDLAIPDLFILNEEETNWSIDVLDVGEKVTFNTGLSLTDNITEDTMISCRLKISSDEVNSFKSPDYSIMVYGVRPFEGNYIPIIGLHAIEDHIEEPIELYTDHFDNLCKVLKELSYETITFTDLLNYIDHGKALPERPVIITSDDGFQDVYTNGFPILKKYGYKMTVFLVTGAIGDSDADRKTNAYFNKRTELIRPILIWPEIIEMNEYGCEFLSHTVNHVRLGLSSDEEFLYELTKSKKDIESHLGNEVLFFAWPYDNNSPLKWPLIPEAGYRGAVRYWGGTEDMRTINLYDIKRVEFNSYIPPNQYVNYLKLDRSIIIEYMIDEHIKETGQEFTVEYTIKNTNKENVKINSLELELPGSIELVEVSPDGYINQYPGISNGMYMWVSDSYMVEGKDEINLIIKLKGTGPGKSLIKFRVTSHESYIDCDDIEMEIKD
ncbi:MAG: polysaccharide deacetylase family protein [Chloroflexi bacterium]|nr:polysaccharide deacetylase family protein [Chloroflexota bacterium]MBE3114714.1 polysaccharide deacetylase family protein [Actinomycetota bacterium]